MPLNSNGHEVPDPTPMTVPAGFEKPESLRDQMLRMIRGHFLAQRSAEGYETPEEAEDFDVDDGEPELASRWEWTEDQEAHALKKLAEEQRKAKEQQARREAEAAELAALKAEKAARSGQSSQQVAKPEASPGAQA